MKKLCVTLIIILTLGILLCGCGAQTDGAETGALTSELKQAQSGDNSSVSSGGKLSSEPGSIYSESSTGESDANEDTSSSTAPNTSSSVPSVGGSKIGTKNPPHQESTGKTPAKKEASSSQAAVSEPASQTSSIPKTNNSGGDKASREASKPAETEKPKEESNQITVTISVDCKTAVDAGYEIASAVSESGYILSGKTLVLNKNASVYDALKQSGLVVSASGSAMGMYVSAIQSLKEKACGNGSGWLYSVNGTYSNKSCDKFTLSDGDSIRWRYSCDNGKDL
ncbi:MAG TPA: hypothetical protein DEQ02_07275 [Ruminococcaceae bacterium]|nr:hypothetical protein [Oscillospiraceae bacterium]